MDVPRAEALARLDENGIADVVGHLLGSPAARRRDPVRDEEVVRFELVGHPGGDLGIGQEDERRRESIALAREHREVEVVQRHHEAYVVLASQRGECRDVLGIGDPGDERVSVAVVERRRERVGVHAERDGARSAERASDVHALPDRGEHDDHDARAYW